MFKPTKQEIECRREIAADAAMGVAARQSGLLWCVLYLCVAIVAFAVVMTGFTHYYQEQLIFKLEAVVESQEEHHDHVDLWLRDIDDNQKELFQRLNRIEEATKKPQTCWPVYSRSDLHRKGATENADY